MVRHSGQEKSPPGIAQPAEPTAIYNIAASTHMQPKATEAQTSVTKSHAHLYYPEEFPKRRSDFPELSNEMPSQPSRKFTRQQPGRHGENLQLCYFNYFNEMFGEQGF